jgi:hypothetical protein
MNLRPLAKLYDRLTPLERLPLLIAAGAHGDQVEQERLNASAPKHTLQVLTICPSKVPLAGRGAAPRPRPAGQPPRSPGGCPARCQLRDHPHDRPRGRRDAR